VQDHWETPQGKWSLEHSKDYEKTLILQVHLQSIGIAWHNPMANECTKDVGCCTLNGSYKVRINRFGEYRTWVQDQGDDRIPKSILVHNAYYLNKNSGRGMKIGKWESNKGKFLCIKGPKFGHYEVYEMPHFEDDDGTAIFEPIQRLQ
jgi:hypothetical protein